MKMERPRLMETRHARLERISDRLIEIRFKPDVLLDAHGIGEVIAAKRVLCADGEPDVLAVLAPDMDLDVRVVHMDHHAMHGTCGNARRLAFVSPNDANARMAEIHYRYHPREYATEVFGTEEDARKWLANEAPQPSLS